MKINELFETELNFEITGIVDDSRDVKDGYLFVATKGFNVDHYDFIDKAIENGCSCVIADREVNYDIPLFFCYAKIVFTSEIKINAFILYFSRFALLCFAKIGFTSDVLLSDSEK